MAVAGHDHRGVHVEQRREQFDSARGVAVPSRLQDLAKKGENDEHAREARRVHVDQGEVRLELVGLRGGAAWVRHGREMHQSSKDLPR